MHRNITQVFRVQLLLSNSESEQVDVFADNFHNTATWFKGETYPFQVTHGAYMWAFCSHSNHLICLDELETLKEAEEVEQLAFELLSIFGYFVEEEE